jgi:adenylate cyclase
LCDGRILAFSLAQPRELVLTFKRVPTVRLGRHIVSTAVWLIPIALGAVLTMSQLSIVTRLQNLVFDGYLSFSPRQWSPASPVRVIDIDDESLAKYGQWPWPRTRLAQLTSKLQSLGAAAIGFDIVFAEPDQTSPEQIVARLPDGEERRQLAAIFTHTDSHSEAFAEAIKNSPSVLAFGLVASGGQPPPRLKAGFAFAGDDPAQFLVPHYQSAIVPLPELAAVASGLAAIQSAQEHDLIVRQVPLLYAETGADGKTSLAPSLAAELLRVAQGASTIIVRSSNASATTAFGAHSGINAVKIGDLEIGTDGDGSVRVRFSGYQASKRHISAIDVLEDQVDPENINGKIILVGASALGLHDIRATPLEGTVPGVDIHAELIEHIVANLHLTRLDFAPAVEAFVLIIGVLVLAFLARRLKALGSAILVTVMIVGIIGFSYWLFSAQDLLFDPITPATTWLATYGTMTVAAFRKTERERRAVRDAFSRYLAPAVVARLVADPSKLRLGGELRRVTILFSDVRNFTSRSETLDAQGVVEFLNRLHTPLTQAVLNHGGTIDKYIGDGLMAFWNAPLDVPDHANAAVAAALDMLAAVPKIDLEMEAEARAKGRPHIPVRIGIGINTGDVFVGNMGSNQRFDYSIVGDPVNVAARLESATKERGVMVLVSEATATAATTFSFQALGEIDLKGKSAATRIFSLDPATLPSFASSAAPKEVAA